jgi:hypothetical protein
VRRHQPAPATVHETGLDGVEGVDAGFEVGAAAAPAAESSSAENTGAVTSDSEFCIEVSASRGLRNTLVLYSGAYDGGCDVVSRIRNSASVQAGSCLMRPSFHIALALAARWQTDGT